jgi:hypothetical protein
MERAIIVRGTLSDPLHIELAEPVTGLRGEVEIVVRSAPASQSQPRQDIFDFIASLPPGTRSKEDIDRQVQEERNAWGDR